MDPVALVRNDICSPIRLFIKDEPHASKKRSSGKLRLISGVGVDDQVLDRMLYGVQNSFEIDHWTECPSKPGMGLSDRDLTVLGTVLSEMLSHGPVQGTDISGWDWSVQNWEMELDSEIRAALAGASGSQFHFLLRVRAYCAANKVFCLPDGSLVAQTYPGVQPSGWYCTSSTNSRMRVIARVAAVVLAGGDTKDAGRIIAMGDDAVEGVTGEDVLSWYARLGHKVKEISVSSSLAGIEFCSHRFMPSGLAYPANIWKTIFRFLTHSPSSDQYLDWFSQLRHELRNHPEVDKVIETCRAHAEWAKSNGEQKKQKSAATAPPATCW